MPYTITSKCIGCSLCKKVCPTNAVKGLPKAVQVIDINRCIDCGACGRICPKGAVMDPQNRPCERIRFRSRWPRPVFHTAICNGCAACIQACPVNCIVLSADRGTRETIRYPVLENPTACIACEICQEECPVDAVEMVTEKS